MWKEKEKINEWENILVTPLTISLNYERSTKKVETTDKIYESPSKSLKFATNFNFFEGVHIFL